MAIVVFGTMDMIKTEGTVIVSEIEGIRRMDYGTSFLKVATM